MVVLKIRLGTSPHGRHIASCLIAFISLAISTVGWTASVYPLIGATISKENITFPVCTSVVDVTKPPYNAKGDGRTDDTDVIQKALTDTMGAHKILYFPNGTYLVSRTLRYTKKNSRGNEAWGFNWIQGQSEANTIIKLKDGVFTDIGRPQPIIWCGGFGSADWFHNYIQNITFDTGRNNIGAVGLNFYSNNSGAIRDVQIVSKDGGTIGLELGNDMNGPLLVRNVIVRGFAVGIRTASTVNSQTFERIGLIGQSKAAFINDGQSIAIRGLYVEGTVTALRANSFTCLLDARLAGWDTAGNVPAIQVGKRVHFFARDISTSGYKAAIEVEEDEGVVGPMVTEFMTGKPTIPFNGAIRSLHLPVAETPDVLWDEPENWAVVEVPDDNNDASPAIQKAVDSGTTTIFIANHHKIVLKSPVVIRGKVRRVIGCGNEPDYFRASRPDFVIADGASSVVIFEHFANINGGIVVDTNRTVVFRSVGTRLTFNKKCDVFLEDYCGRVRLLPGQRLWARQLNIENQGTHLKNDNAMVWILGYKTERGGTLIHTKGGGRTELFGNFSYTTTAGKLAPMFVTEDSSAFVYFNEVCYNGDPFTTLISETHNDLTRIVEQGQGWIAPYVSVMGSKQIGPK
ncbi:glycosyl hydrolase family 28-related protein [Planctomycetota bacterium]